MNGRVGVILAVALGLGLIGVLAGLSGGTLPVESFESNAFSRSYVGHRALVAFLREAGFDVVVNRARLDPTREDGIRGVAFLEPAPGRSRDRLPWEPEGERFESILVALPKWQPAPSMVRRGWIGDRAPLPASHVASVGAPWALAPAPSNRETAALAGGASFEVEAEGLRLFADVAEALVVAGTRGGALAARDPDRADLVWLSDPDVLSNGGLGRRENAAFAEALFTAVFPGRATILDEAHHGFEWNPGLLGLLVTFPGVVPVLGTLLFLFFLGWALVNDWGGGGALPILERSRLEQARNVGRLMVSHGRHGAGLALYVDNVRGQLCDWFHLDRSAPAEAVADHLERTGGASAGAAGGFRAAARAAGAQEGGASPSAVLARARKVHDLLRRGHDDVRSRTERPGRR